MFSVCHCESKKVRLIHSRMGLCKMFKIWIFPSLPSRNPGHPESLIFKGPGWLTFASAEVTSKGPKHRFRHWLHLRNQAQEIRE